MALSDTIFNDLMKRFDCDSDGTISLEEFKTMMYEQQGKRGEDAQHQNSNRGGSFWRGLGRKLKKALSTRGVTRKLDSAFQISDIERIENMGDSAQSSESKMFVDSELTPLTLALFLKEEVNNIEYRRFSGGTYGRDANDPLVIMCSKPGHVEAWVEAFRICTAWQCQNIDWGADEIQRGESCNDGAAVLDAASSDWRCSTIDWGVDDDEVEKQTISNKRESTPFSRQYSTVDWGS